jgi:sialic acid synthase SpsE
MKKIKVGKKIISKNSKTYFIADIGANHDGDLRRAKKLIKLCAKAGADAAKFQHFRAKTIVSDFQFKKLNINTHQKKWKKSVYEVYNDASINSLWNKILKKECKKNNIDFLTSPYDLNYVDEVNKFIPAYKIGSGDITWKDIIIKIAKKKKPVIIATGASTFTDVMNAVKLILKYNSKLIVMQCNTNYTADEKNFNHINLNVLKQFSRTFKDKIILGLSDHTQGHTTVLGAIALGAKVIEKHFTDDNKRKGPDHKFSMTPETWHTMVIESRRLEKSLGDGIKKVEKNEITSFVVQRRGVYANRKIKKNEKLKKEMIEFLRPYLKGSISPFEIENYIGKKLKKDFKEHEVIKKKWMI